MQIRENAMYIRRDGKTVGPAKLNELPNEAYPWIVGGWLYRDDGTSGTSKDLDLVDEAMTETEMLKFLLSRFVMHSPKMDGKHSWRFDSTSWPMDHAKGSTIEEAIEAAMEEEKRYNENAQPELNSEHPEHRR